MPPKQQQPSKKTVDKAKAKIVEVNEFFVEYKKKQNDVTWNFLGQNIWFEEQKR